MLRSIFCLTAATTLSLGVGLEGAEPSNTPDAEEPSLTARVKMKTTLGDIILDLDGDKAPITVINFLRYANSDFYNGTIFHRVISNFMIQGGGFTANMDKKTDGTFPQIKNEWKNGLKNMTGTIAMARLGGQADSASSEFFINVADNGALDVPRDGAGYAVFGKVVEGMDVVEKIKNVPLLAHPKYSGSDKVTPVDPVIIESVVLLNNFDAQGAKAKIAKGRTDVEKPLLAVIKKAEEETGGTMQKTASGLIYFVAREGDGPSPTASDTVQVHYRGTFLDGKEFDSSYSRNAPATFPLNGVISGWTEGVALMKTGAKWRFIIPGDLAYGPRGRSGIPPNATLVFDIELLAVNP
jgi:peptidyl-prolyl cis-trans isomerase A (cyclophilin A)